MIHYHGTPIGGRREEVARFLAGRHALIPFPRPEDLPVAADVCQSFILDNGAFSVWKNGGTLDVDGYMVWVRDWHMHPGFDWALIQDVINGSEAANDDLLKSWPADLRGVPVWHLHESLERLDRLVSERPTVALGSSGKWAMPGRDDWWLRIRQAMDVACDQHGRPRCRLHGLRMLNPEVFSRLPLASADSTNAAQNCDLLNRFGIYKPPTSGQRAMVIASRIEACNSPPVWLRDTQRGLWDDGCEAEVSPSETGV
jgi:hypothetical protein